MKTAKKYYSKEYKLKAVALCEQRENVIQVAIQRESIQADSRSK